MTGKSGMIIREMAGLGRGWTCDAWVGVTSSEMHMILEDICSVYPFHCYVSAGSAWLLDITALGWGVGGGGARPFNNNNSCCIKTAFCWFQVQLEN